MSQNQPVKPHEGVDKSTSLSAFSKNVVPVTCARLNGHGVLGVDKAINFI